MRKRWRIGVKRLKNHIDTLIIVGMILVACKWADGKFCKIGDRLSSLEKEVGQIKTVLIIRGFMPESLAMEECHE